MTRHDPERADHILGYIEDFITEHGYGPSVREIARAMGLASTSAVHHWLRKLREAGRLDWSEHQARTLSVRRPSLDDLTTERIELAWCLSTHGAKPPKVRPCKRHRLMAEWLAEIVLPRALELA